MENKLGFFFKHQVWHIGGLIVLFYLGCQMIDFENGVKKLYSIGSTTFLTKNVVGDDETFYYHCLRYYMPRISRDIWTKHKVGIGVFTMQGFERRNKESKNVLKRFSNTSLVLLVKPLMISLETISKDDAFPVFRRRIEASNSSLLKGALRMSHLRKITKFCKSFKINLTLSY